MSVKITSLQAENVKRIKAVQITPAANGLTVVGGGNNQGKTSVLDAIAWALGGEKYRPDAAQREGANTPPHLLLTLSNGFVVERRGKNSALTVTDPSGKRGGQQLLNEFVEQFALDLPRFMQAGEREKADTLLRIIGVGDRLAAIDQKIKALYDKRTAVGQIATQKKHYADEMTYYPDVPEEPVSASELIRQQQAILAKNGENQRKRDQLTEITHAKNRFRDQLADLDERLNLLKKQREELLNQYNMAAAQESIALKSVADLQDESTAELEASLESIEAVNAKVRANLDKARAEDDAQRMADEYSALTGKIKELRGRRLELLEGAHLPLPGLDVQDGALTYNGKHWGDISGSDQLRVAAAIVRCLNPKCGFLLLDKLEQMDLRTLTEFGAWLESEGLQAIATRVSTGGECQILIEDGRVVGQDYNDTAARQPKAWMKGAF